MSYLDQGVVPNGQVVLVAQMNQTVVHCVCYEMKTGANGEEYHEEVLYVGRKLVRGSFHELKKTERDKDVVDEVKVVSKTGVFEREIL